jgi:Zn-dependent metalloprotease
MVFKGFLLRQDSGSRGQDSVGRSDLRFHVSWSSNVPKSEDCFEIRLECGILSNSVSKCCDGLNPKSRLVMTRHCCFHNPIQCILPPHILDAIKLRGNAGQRQMALDLESDARQYRDERQTAAPAVSYLAAPLVSAGALPQLNREVYDAKNSSSLPGTLVRKEGDTPVGDVAVNAAYDGSGDVYKLYFDIYKRDSLDGNGMILMSTVHYRKNYNNARWNGSQMAYGDGDGIIFLSLLRSLSIIGHELSHGVVQFSGGLIYQDNSGALNESFADIFGCLTVQYKKKQEAYEADWLVGDGIFGPNIQGLALRSLKAPGTAYDDRLLGKDPQPYHMDDYVMTSRDYGGVHINSGIPNHAFYLLSQYLGSYAWEKAGHIWYDTLLSINNPNATFHDWADKTVEMAHNRFGQGSIEVQFTRRAWKLVGLSV